MPPSTTDAWNATKYNTTASFVYSDAFTAPILDLLNAQSGEKIVDFGCGTGELTKLLTNIVGVNGTVLGLDASENMKDAAIANGVQCEVFDLQDPLPSHFIAETYDAVFTNAALHWCKRDPSAVIRNAYTLLRPGGRFTGEMGGFGNIVGIRAALHHVLRTRGHDPSLLDPWYFPSADEYKALLKHQGFEVQSSSLHPRLTPLSKSGLRGWMDLFGRNLFLGNFNDVEADQIMSEVEEMCGVDLKDSEGDWTVVYVRLRFVAIKRT